MLCKHSGGPLAGTKFLRDVPHNHIGYIIHVKKNYGTQMDAISRRKLPDAGQAKRKKRGTQHETRT